MSFEFVLCNDDICNIIIEHYRKEYNNNDDAVKSSIAGINCGFGIRNDKIFMLALTDACDSYYHHSWDKYRFLVILFEDNSVTELECNRIDDEVFEIDKTSPALAEYTDMLTDAVNFYRNRNERTAFESRMKENDSEFRLSGCKYSAYGRIIDMLEPSFGYLLDRIDEKSSIVDSLKELIRFCELTAPEYGIDNTVFGEPLSAEEIEEWERTHEIRLPATYKELLMFADGISVNDSSNIFSLGIIGEFDKYMEEGYTTMGSIVGDGTMICFSKDTGIICEYDHGEIIEVGDINSLIRNDIICY